MTGWDLTYTAFVSPVSVAFSSTDHVDGLVGVDIAASALYFIDLAMNFSVGYVVQTFDGHQIEIHDGPMIAYYYITRGTFIYDALASLAIVAEIVVISKNAGVGWRIWYALRLLRLTRVVRILKSIMSLALLNHKPQRLFLSRINSSTLVAMSLVYIFFVIVQVMGW